MDEFFRKSADRASDIVGSPWAFVLAAGLLILWAVSGPIFGFSDTWQLVINTGTTIITFLMVFLIQNTQNRDAKAMHLKLDELIKSSRADDQMIDLDKLSDKQMKGLEAEYKRIVGRGDGAAAKALE